ncbi:alpha/beta hydrolase [Actinokineospora spheciospongiae]|uniref:alpha/beta hydrolase n=1 Tax=Actinokineospora spheciospongiae TaxID=909613 RepID=UPI002D7938AD|nr:alpha/beta hydrolase family protein [Actinokineospora spheciospongiae]
MVKIMAGVRARRVLGVLATAITASALVWVTHPSAQAAAPVQAVADDGARVVAQQQVDSRTIDLTIQSPALNAQGKVRLLLPRGWAQGDGRSWPTLWLLHGCCENYDYQSWTHFTDVEQFTADKPVIVVMPTAGKIGMYSDWWNYGWSSTPNWRQFHMVEVMQIVSRHYGASGRKSVAGLSMGAYGALEYATRYPGTFGSAAAYSGAPDVLAPGIPEITQLNVLSQGFPIWNALWGDPYAQRQRWMEHNPADKLAALRGTELFISAGNGDVGPLDPDGKGIVPGLLESAAYTNSKTFAEKATRAGIPITTDFYAPGTHSWPYWERELKRSWPMLARGMGI